MKLFARLYAQMMVWAKHPYAKNYLAAVSFAESSFFPIPPDVMLIPMSLAKPQQALRYAWLTTLFSLLGGILGYLLGAFAMHWVEPWLLQSSYEERYLIVRGWFDHWGLWIILIAGFSPIPYKLFTVTAGALSMPFIPFVIASILGRGGRFFLVAGLIARFGDAIEPLVRKYVDWLGWIALLMIIMAYWYFRY